MAQIPPNSAQADFIRPRKRSGRPPARVNGTLYAALDLGTNSCRMLIAQPEGEHFRIVDAFAKSVRLGGDLERDGNLSRASIERTIRALQICATKLSDMDVVHRRLVATEACRRAGNGRHFLNQVHRRTGLELELIRPDEEARLAVISCAPLIAVDAEQVLIFDIGGGSTELVWIDISEIDPEKRANAVMGLQMHGGSTDGIEGAHVVDFISVPLGVATLHERFDDVDNEGARFALMSCFFEEHIGKFTPYQDVNILEGVDGFQMIGTSGTVTTVAAAHLGLKRYDRRKVDGLSMRASEIDVVVNRMLAQGQEGRRLDPSIGRDRAELIMSGAAILQTLLRIWPTDSLRVADRGLREGMLYAMMCENGELKDSRTRG